MKEETTGKAPRSSKRANELNGSEWTRFSISVWRDIRKTPEESKLRHPAMFPTMLTTRLIRCFAAPSDKRVLDPFMGSGSTLVSALNMGKQGIGFEINHEYIQLAERRLAQKPLIGEFLQPLIYHESATQLEQKLEPESVHLCITSPPYWDILSQKRTADYKEIRDYGDMESDLSKIVEYDGFLDSLANIFRGVYGVLAKNKYCIVNVMDLRKKDKFYPLHCDLSARMQEIGFIWDDVIIWDRRDEYSNLRSLGYPYVFRINKIHEYLLIFKKPG
jgi:DNA modification methylase